MDKKNQTPDKQLKRFAIDKPFCNALTPEEAKRIGCPRLLTKVNPFCLGPRCNAWCWIQPNRIRPVPDKNLKDAYIAEDNESSPTHGFCGEIGLHNPVPSTTFDL